MRRTLIAGNWKLYKTPEEAVSLVTGILAGEAPAATTEVLICPPFTALAAVAASVKGSWLQLGGQNLHWEREGAFTGEVSAEMLAAVGCTHVIIGHSERRTLFGETNASVQKKIVAALRAGLVPIVCVGETLAEREQDQTFSVIRTQVLEGLKGFTAQALAQLVIAYEPVWAIGTGKTATPEQAEKVHAFIRKLLGESYSAGFAAQTRILYGGSVKPNNVQTLMQQTNIDGALVGGASLDAASFLKLIHFQVPVNG